MFGDSCWALIQNNTAPNGTVTKALEGLHMLHEELDENSGVDDWSSFV